MKLSCVVPLYLLSANQWVLALLGVEYHWFSWNSVPKLINILFSNYQNPGFTESSRRLSPLSHLRTWNFWPLRIFVLFWFYYFVFFCHPTSYSQWWKVIKANESLIPRWSHIFCCCVCGSFLLGLYLILMSCAYVRVLRNIPAAMLALLDLNQFMNSIASFPVIIISMVSACHYTLPLQLSSFNRLLPLMPCFTCQISPEPVLQFSASHWLIIDMKWLTGIFQHDCCTVSPWTPQIHPDQCENWFFNLF